MKGVPAGMGDWSIKGVLHEAGRLLSKHLRDFLPTILVFIFPATLIKILHTQFFVAAFGLLYFPEPTSFWLVLLLALPLGLFLSLPVLLIPIGFLTLAQVLNDSIYTSDLKAERHSQSLYTSVKLAFRFRTLELIGDSSQVRLWEAKWKILKGSSAVYFCRKLWIVISGSGTYFTPEALTAMELPLWTIFPITLVIVTVTTVITSYSMLVQLVTIIWIISPKTQCLDLR